MNSAVWLFFAGNIITVLVGGVTIWRWFRNWLVAQISEPIQSLHRIVEQNSKNTQRAHTRIDRHLEVHNRG